MSILLYTSKMFIFIFLIIASLAYATYVRNTIWKDEMAFWKDVEIKSPLKERGYNNLGITYSKKRI